MTTEPTAEAPPPAVDLAAFTASKAPVIEVPPGTSTPIARMLVDACRRVAVRLKDGRVLAVLPDPSCRKCHGSTTYRVRSGVEVMGCVCVQRRALRFGHDFSSAPPEAKKPDASDKTAPVSDDRAKMLAALEAKLADMEAQRDEIIEAPAKRMLDATAAKMGALARRDRMVEDAAALDREADDHRRLLAYHEEMARQERASIESLSTAAAKKRNSVAGVDVEVSAANASMQEAEAERQRVIARWDDRMAATRKSVAKLRRKMGLPDCDKSADSVVVTATAPESAAGPLLSPWEAEDYSLTGDDSDPTVILFSQVRRYTHTGYDEEMESATSADDCGLWAYWRRGESEAFASGTVEGNAPADLLRAARDAADAAAVADGCRLSGDVL